MPLGDPDEDAVADALADDVTEGELLELLVMEGEPLLLGLVLCEEETEGEPLLLLEVLAELDGEEVTEGETLLLLEVLAELDGEEVTEEETLLLLEVLAELEGEEVTEGETLLLLEVLAELEGEEVTEGETLLLLEVLAELDGEEVTEGETLLLTGDAVTEALWLGVAEGEAVGVALLPTGPVMLAIRVRPGMPRYSTASVYSSEMICSRASWLGAKTLKLTLV